MASSLWLLLLSFTSLYFLVSADENYVIASESDPCPTGTGSTCNTLSFYANQSDLYFNDDAIFYFLPGRHSLDGLLVINEVSNLTIIGMGDSRTGFHETVMESSVQIECTNNTTGGLSFRDSEYIAISGITFTNCGAPFNDTKNFLSAEVYTTINFVSNVNVTIDGVSILNGTGMGLLLQNTFDITIKSSSFSRNIIPPCETEILCPGGNVQIQYFDVESTDNFTEINIEVTSSNFSFGYSTELGINAGLGLTVMSATSYISLNMLLDRLIIHGNTALLSPNLYCYLECQAGISYYVTINNTISVYGNALTPLPSAILDVLQINSGGLYFHDTSRNHSSARIDILNSDFSHNSVSNHGGIRINVLTYKLMLTIENCNISNNTGNIGSALNVFASRSFNKSSSLALMTLRNVNFSSNSLIYIYSDPLVGTVLVQNLDISATKLLLYDNVGTGLVTLGSILRFTGDEIIFRNNSGVNGGGLALYESSFIILTPPVYIRFLDNWAQSKGGGIFVGQLTYATSNIETTCFYQLPSDEYKNYDQGTLEIFFNGNSAGESGSVLYGGNVEKCSSDIRFARAFNYSSQTGNSVISSDVVGYCYCTDEILDCLIYRHRITAVAGEIFTIPIAAVGQKNGITSGVLQLTDYTMPTPTVTNFSLAPSCNTIKYTIQVDNSQQVLSQLYLTREGVANPVNDSNNKLVEVSLQPCPPGFKFDRRMGWCQCEAVLLGVRQVECNVTTQSMTRSGGVWMGYNNESRCTYIQENCPFGYCITDNVTFNVLDPDPQCALNRSGVMCGGCAEGLSLKLGNDQCAKCSNGYIALIILFALAGIGLVALIVALNLTVSMGTINGIIFYANIVTTNSEILFPDGLVPVLSQFIAWLNLDFGIEVCFYDGMTALGKAWLQFVFPFYIWILVVILIILARYSTRIAKLLGNNAVPVLSTLLLLAYTKIFIATIDVLNGTVLRCGSISTLVWYNDPNVNYNDSIHVILVIFASVFLFVFALPYTLVLLFNYHLGLALNSTRCRVCGCHKQRLSIRLIFETYNSPYKDYLTFWTGLLLLIRFISVFVVAFSKNEDHQAAMVTMISFVIVLQAAFGGVYKKKALDILELWSLLNLMFILIFADKGTVTIVTTSISVTLALITFIGILAFHIALKVQSTEKGKKWLSQLKTYYEEKRSKRKIEVVNELDTMARDRTVSVTSIEINRRETLLTSSYESEAIVRKHSNKRDTVISNYNN